MFEMIYNLHQTNGIAMAIFAVWVETRQLALIDSGSGTSSGAPFFVNDSPLFFYLYGVERQTVSPIVEHQQTTVELPLSYVCWDIIDIINGFLDTCISIHTIVGADALKKPVDTFT